MQAIILAAGMGRGLKELTRDNTKCMVEVNGVKLIDRMLHQIEKKCLSRIVIVVGYQGRKLMDHVETLGIRTPIVYINNPIYDKTNNIYSLALARDFLKEDDTLLFESDLIFEDSVIDALLDDPRDTLALVDKYESWMDGTCVTLGGDDSITAFVPGEKFRFDEIGDYYKTVNIYKFGRHFSESYYIPFLDAYQQALGVNEYYEQVLRVITMLDDPKIKARRLDGQLWYEINDAQDLDIAASMFASDGAVRLLERYGGYWRYPQMLDFCYLVNPYFPPRKMYDEIGASLEKLISRYPSGMRVNSLLAARNFGVHPENIVVGNGTAELIRSFMAGLTGKVGIVRPTFEEYPLRYAGEDIVCFWPENDDFHYSGRDLTRFFEQHPVDSLVLINPDNPSGNYIPKAELIELTAWAGSRGMDLLVDESFADFAQEENNTLIEAEFLEKNPHLYVMKSISKSYGIPGIRLGVLASGCTRTIAGIKKDVSIWNINSLAEFYMQIEGKYRKDYTAALAKFKIERARYEAELGRIAGLRVIPSQANYVMAELTNGTAAAELAEALIVKHKILIKDLSEKIRRDGRQYVRLTVRTTRENDKLIAALRAELGESGGV